MASLAFLAVVSFRGGTLPSETDAHGPGIGAIESLAGCTENRLPANDDSSTTDPVTLPFEVKFLGEFYKSVFVNNNGNVTFDNVLRNFAPQELLAMERAIIAPFFADVDTRGDGSGEVTFGSAEVDGRQAFCVNWIDVGYWPSRASRLNSFQLLLVDRSDTGPGNFDMTFNYDKIEWESSAATGGVDGLGGETARAGYSDGLMEAFELQGSGVAGSFLDTNPTGLVHGSRNSDVAGRYVFRVRDGDPMAIIPTPTPEASPTPVSPGRLGDVDCDDVVDSVDAALILQFAEGLLRMLPCESQADVDEDGQVGHRDAIMILEFEAGLRPSFAR